ncbi:MAG: glycoside hydrolase family 55 protein [Actinomycetota bacterium]|nr:glycoside hydrolase family 55 protein [Actinomycetota bacterium]
MVDYGADPTGAADSSNAFDAAVAAGRSQGRVVWIPQGPSRSRGTSPSTTSPCAERGRGIPCCTATGWASTATTPPTSAATCSCTTSPSSARSGSATTRTRSTPSARR